MSNKQLRAKQVNTSLRRVSLLKTVFITGVKRELGLGTALVRKYLGEGFVVFASARGVDQEHLAALKGEWGEKLWLVDMDVTKVEDVRAAADVIREKAGRLDILISNATATYHEGNLPIDDGLNIENGTNAYNVNALGFIRMVQEFLPLCSEGAKLTAITSEAGSMGDCWRDDGIDYGMAKAALNFACVTLQRRLGKKGFRVLAIHPGWVQTRPAPPKADLTPEESAAAIFKLIDSPPEYVEKGNIGVYVNWNGTHKAF